MKKITAILLVFTILAFTGCGKATNVDNESESGLSSEAPKLSTEDKAAAHNAAIQARDVHIVQFEDPDPGDTIAVVTTSEGEIKIRLFSEQAPKTVEEFIRLSTEGGYNGQQFHTVVEGYKIECGPTDGSNPYPEEGEFSLDLWNFRGAVALANNGSDFLIVQANRCLNPIPELEALNFPKSVIEKYDEIGGAPHQDWVNTVFGQVISGMEVVDKIAAAKLAESSSIAENSSSVEGSSTAENSSSTESAGSMEGSGSTESSSTAASTRPAEPIIISKIEIETV